MNKSRLDPKTLSPDAWKGWMKDTFSMIKRLGLFGWFGLPVLLLGMTMGIATIIHGKPLLSLLTLPFCMAIGMVVMVIQYNMMGRARRGEAPSPMTDISAGISEVLGNLGWSGHTLKVALMFAAGMMAVLTLLFLMASMGADPEKVEQAKEAKVVTMLDTALAMLSQMSFYIWALRPRGFLSMTYFLEVRENVDRGMAKQLEMLGAQRNGGSLGMAVMILAMGGLAVLTFGTRMEYLAYLIIPMGTWFMAGVNVCAWHEIFDPDGGLAEKQSVEVLGMSQVAA